MTKPTCAVDGCGVQVHSRGWCSMHYQRWRNHGDPLTVAVIRMSQKGLVCVVEGCNTRARKRGWCATHYAQHQRTGESPQPFKWKWASETSCLVCGSTEMDHKSRRYCSGRCQVLASNARRGSPMAVVKLVRCVRCSCLIDLFGPGVSHSSGRPNTSGRKRRSDSKLCADCRRQRGYRHHWSAQALAVRDGTDCRICGLPVDMNLRAPDKFSPSVDHIVSRAHGGSNDPANLQLAHLTCNHQKSRRSGWTLI